MAYYFSTVWKSWGTRARVPHLFALMLKAGWLRPVFAESYELLRVNQAKELVAIRVWNVPDQSLSVYYR